MIQFVADETATLPCLTVAQCCLQKSASEPEQTAYLEQHDTHASLPEGRGVLATAYGSACDLPATVRLGATSPLPRTGPPADPTPGCVAFGIPRIFCADLPSGL